MNKIGSISLALVKVASRLLKKVKEADKSDKITVFLGGQCDDSNSWRKEIKNHLKDRILYLDPFDKKWEASDNIYDELAGLLISDNIIFYKGGIGTKREKDFLDIVQPETEYGEFDNIEDMKQYLDTITKGKTANEWSKKIKPKVKVQDGIFLKGPRQIANYLLNKGGGKAKAMQRLNFYINRAGDNLSRERMKVLDRVHDILEK